MNSSLTLEGAGATDFLFFFSVAAGDGGVGMGAGARGWSGSTSVLIIFKTGSGSPVCSLRLGDDDGGCEMKSMRAGSDPGLNFAFKSLESRGGPEFTGRERQVLNQTWRVAIASSSVSRSWLAVGCRRGHRGCSH